MEIRGDRECQECGTQWSYYDTGSVSCPQCESLRSVGVDDRKQHTSAPVTLDLTEIRTEIDEEPLEELARRAAAECSEYVRQRGFIHAGTLQPLDDTYVAATELKHVARLLDRSLRADSDEEYYLLSLLRGADLGERPPREDVPESLRVARGLAYARAVDAYGRDLRSYLDGETVPEVGEVLSALAEHRKRVEALDGDIPVSHADALLEAAKATGRYLIEDDESALAVARSRLDRLDPAAE